MSSLRALASSGWSNGRITLILFAAILAPLAAAIALDGLALLVPTVIAVTLAMLWQVSFSLIRKRALAWDSVITALIVALLVSQSVPLWQMAVALSFGLVMGDLIFGGRGRGFLTAATVSVAFLLFSFDQPSLAPQGMAMSLAIAAGGAVLLWAHVLSWRVVLGFAITFAGLVEPWSQPEIAYVALEPVFLIGLVFLVGDPVAAASTNPGRWAYGALAGGLIALFVKDGSSLLSAVIFGTLLASIFAPMIDQAVIQLNVKQRARRQQGG